MSPVGSLSVGSRSLRQHSIQRHSRSFSFANCLLPATKRADVERLYAWCRWCDDGVDCAASPQAAECFLQQAVADVGLIAAGMPPLAVESGWLESVVRRHDIPLAAAFALLEGMRCDLGPAAGWNTDDLLRYCFRAAGAVGVLMCPILGLEDRRYLRNAAALGMGMQMTNIARDVAEDWRRGRCYLPVEWSGGLYPSKAEPEPEVVKRGVRELLAMADDYYIAGERGVAALARESRLAVRAASKIYHAIGVKIRRRQYQVLDQRFRVSFAGKMRLFVSAVLAGRCERQTPLSAGAVEALTISENLLYDHGVLS